MKLSELTVGRLLNLYAGTVKGLRQREVIASNDVVGGYAATLLCRALRLRPEPVNKKSYDATDTTGKRYQLKGRWRSGRNPALLVQMKDTEFEYLAVVLFNENLSVTRACRIPVALFRELALRYKGSWRLRMGDSVWRSDGVEDISRRTTTAAAWIGRQR